MFHATPIFATDTSSTQLRELHDKMWHWWCRDPTSYICQTVPTKRRSFPLANLALNHEPYISDNIFYWITRYPIICALYKSTMPYFLKDYQYNVIKYEAWVKILALRMYFISICFGKKTQKSFSSLYLELSTSWTRFSLHWNILYF